MFDGNVVFRELEDPSGKHVRVFISQKPEGCRDRCLSQKVEHVKTERRSTAQKVALAYAVGMEPMSLQCSSRARIVAAWD